MKRNLSLLSDFYEFTMANAFIEKGMADDTVIFDLYFRNVPDCGGYVVVAGLEQVIDYIENLKFTEDDIEYFKSKNMFSENFYEFLLNFKFTGDIWAMPEGSIAFPNEPLLTIKAPIAQCQILETMFLLTINHQSLIATKASRIHLSAKGRAVMEFGARRAQGPDASIYGARAAYIGGVESSSNTICDREYGVPASGTMAHSWVMMFDSEYEAFKAYAETYPDETVLLVDTYNTLKEGVPNAIKVFDDVLKPLGKRPKGIRLDSGDLAYLSKQARIMLDQAGYEDCPIVASSGLDEYTISDLIEQGAKIDAFGVGERLITSMNTPILGGVYKMVAVEKNEKIQPKMKFSDNVEKITTPGFKNLYRLINRETNKAEADLITLYDEVIDDSKDLEIFHPIYTWKRKTIRNFYAQPLLRQIYSKGKLIYKQPSLEEIRAFREQELNKLWEEVKRLEHAHLYIVDLSHDLWSIRDSFINSKK